MEVEENRIGRSSCKDEGTCTHCSTRSVDADTVDLENVNISITDAITKKKIYFI